MSRSQSPPAQTTTPASGEAVAPQPPPAVQVEQSYAGENFAHWIAGVLQRGAQVKLEDGSLWEIAPEYRPQTMFWLTAQKITVVRGVQMRYPFKITNTDKNATVDARLVSP